MITFINAFINSIINLLSNIWSYNIGKSFEKSKTKTVFSSILRICFVFFVLMFCLIYLSDYCKIKWTNYFLNASHKLAKNRAIKITNTPKDELVDVNQKGIKLNTKKDIKHRIIHYLNIMESGNQIKQELYSDYISEQFEKLK